MENNPERPPISPSAPVVPPGPSALKPPSHPFPLPSSPSEPAPERHPFWKSKWMWIAILIVAILIPLSVYVFGKITYKAPLPSPTPVATPTPTPIEIIYANADGGYSFVVPDGWTAATNVHAAKNSLFGPDATNTSGTGGVEIVQSSSLDSYLNQAVSAQYSAKQEITVSGVSGVKQTYGGMFDGVRVALFIDGAIYNIYMNSDKSEDVNKFDQIISTFKFTDPSDETAKIIDDLFTGTNYTQPKVTGVYENYAMGSAGFAEGGGILFYAKELNSKWEFIWRGNETPGCSKFVSYPDLPKELICELSY